jgi:hypothetical protein
LSGDCRRIGYYGSFFNIREYPAIYLRGGGGPAAAALCDVLRSLGHRLIRRQRCRRHALLGDHDDTLKPKNHHGLPGDERPKPRGGPYARSVVLLQIPSGPQQHRLASPVVMIRMPDVGLRAFASTLLLPVKVPKNAEMIPRIFFSCEDIVILCCVDCHSILNCFSQSIYFIAVQQHITVIATSGSVAAGIMYEESCLWHCHPRIA